MLLDTVWIILSETLEAGLLVSLLLSLSARHRIARWWMLFALITGVAGAWLYGANLAVVSPWFDDVGQEVVNGLLQFSIYIALLMAAVLLRLRHGGDITALTFHRWMPWFLLVAVALAFVREGSEIIIFYMGISAVGNPMVIALTSGMLGLLIGMCTGALLYYAIMLSPKHTIGLVQYTLLLLVASGIVLQATQQLLQADWLPGSAPVWNTSSWLPEDSAPGLVLSAMLGYEATPSVAETLLYFSAVCLFLLVPFTAQIFCRRCMTVAQ